MTGTQLRGIWRNVFGLREDKRLAEAGRSKMASDYGGRSVQLLREAVKRGFSDAEILKKEDVWNPIRARDDFVQLIQDLKAAAKQANP